MPKCSVLSMSFQRGSLHKFPLPLSGCLFCVSLHHLWTQSSPQLWTTCSDTCGLMRKCYGGNFRRRLLYFSHCLPLCMGNDSPPPWDPVGTGNFWPVLAACPLPQARLRQQHFRECLSTGGESEKETNSRGPRKLRQTWESFEKKGGWGSHAFSTRVKIHLFALISRCTTYEYEIRNKGVCFPFAVERCCIFKH